MHGQNHIKSEFFICYIVHGVLDYEGASGNSFSLSDHVAVQITTTLNCLNCSVEHNLLPGNVTRNSLETVALMSFMNVVGL